MLRNNDADSMRIILQKWELDCLAFIVGDRYLIRDGRRDGETGRRRDVRAQRA